MISKFLILISVLFTSLVAQAYNREECDSAIDVKKYIIAGSLDNKSSGGKTYNFERIASSLENELLSGQPPDAKRFECLSTLHQKAHEDATDYWVGRLARSTCAGDEDGSVPSVKPANCDDEMWKKFHESKNLIDRTAKRINKLKTECVERKGVKSCEAMAAMQKFEESATELAEHNMDGCCDISTGPAFRVLRGFYTVEFGDLPDADLQKECYKRVRPGNSNAVDGLADGAWTCVKSAARGIAEAVMKWLKTAAALKELGSISEIWRIVRNMSATEVMSKIGNLLNAMMTQTIAQLTTLNDCFTGRYKLDQACKLMSSIAVDFFVGGGIAKGIGILAKVLKGGANEVVGIAKNLVSSSPKISPLMSKLSPKGLKSAGTAANAATRAAAKKAAARMATALKPVADFSKSVASRVKKLREKENIRMNASNRVEPTMGPGPNAATAVNAAETASAAANTAAVATTQSGSRVASTAASTGNRQVIQLTERSAKRIEKDLREFRDDKYKAMYADRGTRAVDNPESLFVRPDKLKGKTAAQKMEIIEQAAKARRAQVDRLAKSNRADRMTAAQSREILDNIDDAVARLRRRYGVPETQVASASARTAGTASSNPVIVRPVEVPAAVTQSIDTAVPTAPATTAAATRSTTPTGVVGSGAPVTTGYTNTAVSFADSLPQVDLTNIATTSAKMSKALQKQLDDIKSFEEKARLNASRVNPAATSRYSVYNNMSNRAISKDAIRRHGEIRDLHKKGIITDEQAHAMHDIVRVTESSATGTATRFNTKYISTPNTNPSTFTLKERNPPASVLGTATRISNRASVGAVMTDRQATQNYDNVKDRYEPETVKQSEAIVENLVKKPSSIRDEFTKLKTETEIMDRADELRLRVKTVENTRGLNPDIEVIDALEELVEVINTERDRALARVKKAAESDKAPASAAPATPDSNTSTNP